jgi:hypothetical protein
MRLCILVLSLASCLAAVRGLLVAIGVASQKRDRRD